MGKLRSRNSIHSGAIRKSYPESCPRVADLWVRQRTVQLTGSFISAGEL